jgi:hypothetical protein
MTVTFTTTVLQAPGLQATGLPVPDDAVHALGDSKKPAVTVRIGDYSYRTTVSSRYGGFIVPLSAAHREAIGIASGDEVEVGLELDLEPRTVDVPDDLATALEKAGARDVFDSLSPSKQGAHVAQVDAAKTQETRARRITAVVAQLGG